MGYGEFMEPALESIVANQMMSTTQVEKSVLDKLFAKEDIARITEIHQKENPSRSDMQELLQLLNGMESKLLNFSEQYPHILGRYFVRIRETFAYYESLEEFYNKIKDRIKDPRTHELFASMIYKLKSTCLTYSSNFQWIERSTMSIEGSAFYNALTTKFELAYPHMSQVPQTKNEGLLGRVFK